MFLGKSHAIVGSKGNFGNITKLKNDIHNAHKSAEEYVKALMASLKADIKVAAKGVLDGALPYIIAGLIMSVFALLVQTCF